MQTSLIITGIGMGLVFVAILLLWGMMELLVRVTPDKKRPTETQIVPDPNMGIPASIDKKKIAAAAVAAAIRLRRQQAAQKAVRIAMAEEPESYRTAQSTGRLSNWQPVMRSAQREDRLRLFSRKPRGS